MKNNITNRREFLKKAGLLFGAGAAVTSLSSLIVGCKDETIPLPPAGATYNISLNEYPNLVTPDIAMRCDAKLSDDPSKKLTVWVRVYAEGDYVITQSNCTHQGDAEMINPATDQFTIVCPRHSAEFSLNKDDAGKLVANPKNVTAGDMHVFEYEYKKSEKIIVIKS